MIFHSQKKPSSFAGARKFAPTWTLEPWFSWSQKDLQPTIFHRVSVVSHGHARARIFSTIKRWLEDIFVEVKCYHLELLSNSAHQKVRGCFFFSHHGSESLRKPLQKEATKQTFRNKVANEAIDVRCLKLFLQYLSWRPWIFHRLPFRTARKRFYVFESSHLPCQHFSGIYGGCSPLIHQRVFFQNVDVKHSKWLPTWKKGAPTKEGKRYFTPSHSKVSKTEHHWNLQPKVFRIFTQLQLFSTLAFLPWKSLTTIFFGWFTSFTIFTM